jgi:hypothetical protein
MEIYMDALSDALHSVMGIDHALSYIEAGIENIESVVAWMTPEGNVYILRNVVGALFVVMSIRHSQFVLVSQIVVGALAVRTMQVVRQGSRAVARGAGIVTIGSRSVLDMVWAALNPSSRIPAESIESSKLVVYTDFLKWVEIDSKTVLDQYMSQAEPSAELASAMRAYTQTLNQMVVFNDEILQSIPPTIVMASSNTETLMAFLPYGLAISAFVVHNRVRYYGRLSREDTKEETEPVPVMSTVRVSTKLPMTSLEALHLYAKTRDEALCRRYSWNRSNDPYADIPSALDAINWNDSRVSREDAYGCIVQMIGLMTSIEASSLVIGGTRHLSSIPDEDWNGYTRAEVPVVGTMLGPLATNTTGKVPDTGVPELGDWYVYQTLNVVGCFMFDVFGDMYHAVSNGLVGLLSEIKTDYEHAGVMLYTMAWSFPGSSGPMMATVGQALALTPIRVFPVLAVGLALSYTPAYDIAKTYMFQASDTVYTIWTVGSTLPNAIYRRAEDGTTYVYTKTGAVLATIKETIQGTIDTTSRLASNSVGALVLIAGAIIVINMESRKRQRTDN